jgi:hypothetical protein
MPFEELDKDLTSMHKPKYCVPALEKNNYALPKIEI